MACSPDGSRPAFTQLPIGLTLLAHDDDWQWDAQKDRSEFGRSGSVGCGPPILRGAPCERRDEAAAPMGSRAFRRQGREYAVLFHLRRARGGGVSASMEIGT